MAKNPLSGLLIRTGAVRLPDVGYIYACDPKKENQDIPHTVVFTWKSNRFIRGEAEYSAHSCCLINHPEPGVVNVSGPGFNAVQTRNGITVGKIYENNLSEPKTRRYGEIRSVATIEDKAYAVGMSGTIFRLDKIGSWKCIDKGISRDFDIEAIHGFSGSDMYAVGYQGEVWHFNGKKWAKREVPTNAYLSCVNCAGNDTVYIAGDSGVLLRGRENSWETIESELEDDIWDLEWFMGLLYASTMDGLYKLIDDEMEPVDFGKDTPETCYHLSAAEGVMWSIGAKDIMSFDGKSWTRVV